VRYQAGSTQAGLLHNSCCCRGIFDLCLRIDTCVVQRLHPRRLGICRSGALDYDLTARGQSVLMGTQVSLWGFQNSMELGVRLSMMLQSCASQASSPRRADLEWRSHQDCYDHDTGPVLQGFQIVLADAKCCLSDSSGSDDSKLKRSGLKTMKPPKFDSHQTQHRRSDDNVRRKRPTLLMPTLAILPVFGVCM
jgi:hypothetical protein